MSTADELRQVWLFEGLTDDQLNSLSPFTYRKKFGPGELIVEEGHTGNGLYLIVSGNVEAVKGLGTQQQQTVNRLGRCRSRRRSWSTCGGGCLSWRGIGG